MKISKKIPIEEVRRAQRKTRIRFKVKGTDERPRLSVFRSNRGLYAQIIDDLKGITLVAGSTYEKGKKTPNNVESAKKLGETIAKAAQSKNIKAVVFDRSGYLYHGKIKALADGARAGGLQF